MINRVTLAGHLGKDPEIKHLDNDVVVANFTIATTESYKDKNGNKIENTEWHSIVAWRGSARFAESYLKKGDLVYIEGKIRTRNWDDKDGNKRYTTEIYVDNLQKLSPRRTDAVTPSTTPQNTENTSSHPALDEIIDNPEDDLPF